jgi:hypothetical protein
MGTPPKPGYPKPKLVSQGGLRKVLAFDLDGRQTPTGKSGPESPGCSQEVAYITPRMAFGSSADCLDATPLLPTLDPM